MNVFFRHDNMKIVVAPSADQNAFDFSIKITDPVSGQSDVLYAMSCFLHQVANDVGHRLYDFFEAARMKIVLHTANELRLNFYTTSARNVERVVYLLMGKYNFVTEFSWHGNNRIYEHQREMIAQVVRIDKADLSWPSVAFRGRVDPEDSAASFKMTSVREPSSAYPRYESEDGIYVIEREYTGCSPKYVDFNGAWVLRRCKGYVDHDIYVNDLLERHTLRGAAYANKP